jgi:phage-related minor tail protein
MLHSKYKEQDSKREAEVQRIENERNEIKERKTNAQEEINLIVEQIKLDAAERAKRDEEMQEENEAKETKIREKMSMEDAARYIQRRWVWFQTEGKFLAKKGKKGRKGKKKKKK